MIHSKERVRSAGSRAGSRLRPEKGCWMKKRGFTALVLALAAVLTVLGAAEGQAKEVLMKAVRVCLECIGIG